MPRVTEAYRAARRRQIAEAARACFAAAGFHNTSMDDICRAAGLSPGAVYGYFSGKDAIIEVMVRDEIEANVRSITEARHAGSLVGALDQLIDFYFGLVHAPGHPARLGVEIWAEATRNPRVGDALRAALRANAEAIAGLIRRAQDVGEADSRLDPAAVADALVALHSGRQLEVALEGPQRAEPFVAAAKALVSGLFRRGTIAGLALLALAGVVALDTTWDAGSDCVGCFEQPL